MYTIAGIRQHSQAYVSVYSPTRCFCAKLAVCRSSSVFVFRFIRYVFLSPAASAVHLVAVRRSSSVLFFLPAASA